MAKRFILRWHVGYTAAIRKAFVLVSDEDAWRLKNRPYYVEYKGEVPSQVAHNTNSGRTKYVLAREIMNPRDDEVVLHLNGDALDCRRSNLKIVKKKARRIKRRVGDQVINDG